jgi:hypothetical protein
MATSYVFGAGTLTIGATSIPVQNVSYEETSEVIELYANKGFAVAIAEGKKSVKGSFTVAGYEDTIVSSIENSVMAPVATATTLAWALPLQGGGTKTFTLANVILTSKKFSSGNDKFGTMEVSYTAFSELSGDTVLTVA